MSSNPSSVYHIIVSFWCSFVLRGLGTAWLARPGVPGSRSFIPAYCPHLDPIERLWGLMHKHVTHNRCHPTFADFKTAILTFLSEEVPRKWHTYCDEVTDNFRVISPKEWRRLTDVHKRAFYAQSFIICVRFSRKS